MSHHNPSCSPLEIAALVRQNDSRAMDRIAACYMGHLLAVGRCFCRDASSAPDAVQDALLLATERLSQFRGEGSVKAWVSRMVVNACHCQSRGRKNSADWNTPIETSGQLPADHENPGELVARAEFLREVAAALETLSSQDRELFLASQLQNVSASELAELYGRRPDAIRAQLTRIRRKLREELAEIWEEWRES